MSQTSLTTISLLSGGTTCTAINLIYLAKPPLEAVVNSVGRYSTSSFSTWKLSSSRFFSSSFQRHGRDSRADSIVTPLCTSAHNNAVAISPIFPCAPISNTKCPPGFKHKFEILVDTLRNIQCNAARSCFVPSVLISGVDCIQIIEP